MTEALPSRPILRWAGSKRALLENIRQISPINFTRYIEPFAGSAAVFVALAPKRAILSDINRGLIGMYRTLRKYPDRVTRQAKRWPSDENSYYRIRKLNPASLSPVGRAARFIYLNRLCFNGVYRENKRGEFNVPFGRSTGEFPLPREFRAFAGLLRSARLECCDFEQTLSEAARGDFVYVDPPYYAPGRDFKGEYGYGAFNSQDEKRLVAALLAASKRGAKILLSYNDVLVGALPDWIAIPRSVVRNVGGFASSRRRVVEYLYTNMNIDER